MADLPPGRHWVSTDFVERDDSVHLVSTLVCENVESCAFNSGAGCSAQEWFEDFGHGITMMRFPEGIEFPRLLASHVEVVPEWEGVGEDASICLNIVMPRQAEENEENEIDAYRELLGAIWLYVSWRYVTKQLTTDQKNLWADAVDATGDPDDRSPKADRWWARTPKGRPTQDEGDSGLDGFTPEELKGLTPEVLRQMRDGDPRSHEVRALWEKWGMWSVRKMGRPAWLFAVVHPAGGSCTRRVAERPCFSTAYANEAGFGFTDDAFSVMPTPPQLCSNCWVELEFVPGRDMRFLFLPNGTIVNPYGAQLT